ncbi:hypothetical protein Hanom_Chr15g01355671 [Helianthus anomalus]
MIKKHDERIIRFIYVNNQRKRIDMSWLHTDWLPRESKVNLMTISVAPPGQTKVPSLLKFKLIIIATSIKIKDNQ